MVILTVFELPVPLQWLQLQTGCHVHDEP